MKIIDLLNKIANGELKAKTRIKYHNKIYIYDFPNLCGIYEENKPTNSVHNLYEYIMNSNRLNEEIEIIEEPKKIEIPKHIPNEVIQNLDRGVCPANVKHIAHKVNELINYLQHKDKINEGE